MYVPGIRDLALKTTQWVDAMIQESQMLLEFREEAQLRHDRRAPPRERAM